MPDHKKIWTNDDYVNSNIALGALKIKNPLCFPGKNSQKSGAIFNRFVNKENLTFVNDTTLPLSARAYIIQDYLGLLSSLKLLYTDNLKEEQYYNKEIIDIDIFVLFLYKNMMGLGNLIMNSKIESDVSIQSGFNTVKNNYLIFISKVLEEQVNSKVFSHGDLERLSREVLTSLIENREWIIPADRKIIVSKVLNIINISSSAIIKDNYRIVLKEINCEN